MASKGVLSALSFDLQPATPACARVVCPNREAAVTRDEAGEEGGFGGVEGLWHEHMFAIGPDGCDLC
jgi:hypothetical protein